MKRLSPRRDPRQLLVEGGPRTARTLYSRAFPSRNRLLAKTSTNLTGRGVKEPAPIIPSAVLHRSELRIIGFLRNSQLVGRQGASPGARSRTTQ